MLAGLAELADQPLTVLPGIRLTRPFAHEKVGNY